jgi:hypothetical protein
MTGVVDYSIFENAQSPPQGGWRAHTRSGASEFGGLDFLVSRSQLIRPALPTVSDGGRGRWRRRDDHKYHYPQEFLLEDDDEEGDR